MFKKIHHELMLYMCFFLLSFSRLYADISYDVEFKGINNKEILATLKSVSQLISLKPYPPATTTALRRRAEADIPRLIKGLQSFAYYDPIITLDVDSESCPAKVILNIAAGPIYPLTSFRILSACFEDEEDDASNSSDPLCGQRNCDEEATSNEAFFDFDTIDPKNLGVIFGKPALPQVIIDAEKALIAIMEKSGYPLAMIEKREVIADQATKTIAVTLYVDSGPLAYFGPTTINGSCEVEDIFFRKKIAWSENQIFDPHLINCTQEAIEASGLFSSIIMTYPDEVNDSGILPIEILVVENRHRTVGIGASYTTQFGPGIALDWEHRNVRGLGEKAGFETSLWEKKQTGKLLYQQPDFLSPGQDLLWLAELERETTTGFVESYFSFSAIVDTQLNPTTKFSYGASFKQLESEKSDNNRLFTLLKFPFQYRWNTSNNLLDPTQGRTVNFKFTPTVSIAEPHMTYYINTLTTTFYYPLTSDERYVLASKISLGSIFGASRYNIPPPERFYAGSENTLRGYEYLTVSPLDIDNKPIGGRSLLIFSIEPRMRLTEKFGLVLFYEIGNVYTPMLPQLNHKQLQSTGIGLRYHTPVGPLRLDIAFPLNPRAGIDHAFQLYFSIGQAF